MAKESELIKINENLETTPILRLKHVGFYSNYLLDFIKLLENEDKSAGYLSNVRVIGLSLIMHLHEHLVPIYKELNKFSLQDFSPEEVFKLNTHLRALILLKVDEKERGQIANEIIAEVRCLLINEYCNYLIKSEELVDKLKATASLEVAATTKILKLTSSAIHYFLKAEPLEKSKENCLLTSVLPPIHIAMVLMDKKLNDLVEYHNLEDKNQEKLAYLKTINEINSALMVIQDELFKPGLENEVNRSEYVFNEKITQIKAFLEDLEESVKAHVLVDNCEETFIQKIKQSKELRRYFLEPLGEGGWDMVLQEGIDEISEEATLSSYNTIIEAVEESIQKEISSIKKETASRDNSVRYLLSIKSYMQEYRNPYEDNTKDSSISTTVLEEYAYYTISECRGLINCIQVMIGAPSTKLTQSSAFNLEVSNTSVSNEPKAPPLIIEEIKTESNKNNLESHK